MDTGKRHLYKLESYNHRDKRVACFEDVMTTKQAVFIASRLAINTNCYVDVTKNGLPSYRYLPDGSHLIL